MLSFFDPAFSVDPDESLWRPQVFRLEVQIVVELDGFGFVGQFGVHDSLDFVMTGVVQHFSEFQHGVRASQLILGAHPVVEDTWLVHGFSRFSVLRSQRFLSLYALEVETTVRISAHLGRQFFFTHEVDHLAGDNHDGRGFDLSDHEVFLIWEFDCLIRQEFVAYEHISFVFVTFAWERQRLDRRDQVHCAVEGSLDGSLYAFGFLDAERTDDVIELCVGAILLEG
jgi:hypothetical protein